MHIFYEHFEYICFCVCILKIQHLYPLSRAVDLPGREFGKNKMEIKETLLESAISDFMALLASSFS